VDGHGKKGDHQLSGLTDTMKRAVFDQNHGLDQYQKGEFVLVNVTNATQNALLCEPIERMSIENYFKLFNGNRSREYLK